MFDWYSIKKKKITASTTNIRIEFQSVSSAATTVCEQLPYASHRRERATRASDNKRVQCYNFPPLKGSGGIRGEEAKSRGAVQTAIANDGKLEVSRCVLQRGRDEIRVQL